MGGLKNIRSEGRWNLSKKLPSDISFVSTVALSPRSRHRVPRNTRWKIEATEESRKHDKSVNKRIRPRICNLSLLLSWPSQNFRSHRRRRNRASRVVEPRAIAHTRVPKIRGEKKIIARTIYHRGIFWESIVKILKRCDILHHRYNKYIEYYLLLNRVSCSISQERSRTDRFIFLSVKIWRRTSLSRILPLNIKHSLELKSN